MEYGDDNIVNVYGNICAILNSLYWGYRYWISYFRYNHWCLVLYWYLG